MKTVGIVAEYDPFHNGHAWQLAEARRLSGADAVVVVMSGFFTQRGSPACLSPFDRAACALAGGADLVALLPAVWSLRSAEGFALGAVRILQGLGANLLSFGAEIPDADLLRRTADRMDSPEVREALRQGLASGLGWPAAMDQALRQTEADLPSLMQYPNCALAVAYLRAASQLHYEPEIIPVQRSHPHHASERNGAFASGSGIREALFHHDWTMVDAAVPASSSRCLHEAADHGRLVFPSRLEQAMMARLRTMEKEDFAALPDVSEGLDQALMNAARASVTREQVLDLVSGKRYPRARVNRLCTAALLGLRREELPSLPDCALIIGVRSGMESLLRPSEPDFPLLVRSRDYPFDAPWFRAEKRAADLWALAAGLPAGLWEQAPLIKAY